MTHDELIQTALSCGATKAAVIDKSAFVLSATFRKLCEANSCGMYNRCWMCPPEVGPIDELIAKVQTYDKGLIWQTIAPLEDSYDVEGMLEAKKAHVAATQHIFDALRERLPGALFLGGGDCGVCEKCAKITGEKCRRPDRAMASMESHGFDVFNTSKRTPLKYINGANTVTYFGIVLYKETENG